MVSIIIVNFEGAELTRSCVASIKRFAAGHPYEIIVVDNNSSGGEADVLKSTLPECRVIPSPENRGFGWANNLGASKAGGDLLFFLNNDTVLASDVVARLAFRMLENPRRGIAAPALTNADGSRQLSWGKHPSLLLEWVTRREKKRNPVPPPEAYDWVTGAAMMVRRSAFEEVGGFDDGYFLYFEDADLCRRITNAGFTVDLFPDISLIHLGGKTRERAGEKIRVEYRRSQLRYYDKFLSLPERLLLRGYLLLKFLPRLVIPKGRSTSAAIIGLLVTSLLRPSFRR